MTFSFSRIVFSTILVRISFSSPDLVLHSSSSSLKNKDMTPFSARLIHRSSPESPFYDPMHATSFDSAKASSCPNSASSVYLRRLRSKSTKYPSSPVDLISQKRNDYVMRYRIGTPPVETFALPDTGSSLTWLQCLSCDNCYNQSIPLFDPRKSSSYQPILCGSQECNNTAYADYREEAQQNCTYKITYVDESYSKGNIASEALTFEDHGNQGNRHYTMFNMLFGCGHNNMDTTGEYFPGLVGLSNHSSSLVNQLGFGGFSYCISSNPRSRHSQIRFGLGASINSERLTTALSPNNEGLYFNDVDGMYVEGKKVDIPEWVFQHTEDGFSGLLIDTGTTYGELYTPALDALILELQNKMPSNMEAESDISECGWSLCYNNKYRFNEVLPEIEFRFRDNDETYPISDQNVWIDNGHGQFCLAMERSNDTSVLGMYQQRDMNVAIDLKNSQVSFKYDFDCAEFV